MTELKTAACPQCGEAASLAKTNKYRPFCSERCKLLDLGEWFDEKKGIPAEDDEDQGLPAQDPDLLQ